MSSPYWDLVPKDPVKNLKWRIACRERCRKDPVFKRALKQACQDDVLFFFAFCLWVHEPRAKVKMQPFIPWPHQVPVLLEMDEAISEAQKTGQPVSLVLKKSRAQGATFSYLGIQIRRALIEPGFSSGLVSRNEKMIDSKADASTVMFKLAMMLDKLPVWMGGSYERNLGEHTIVLKKNGSNWVGYAATGDVARGGRTTMFALDEIGSEEFISGGADYKVMSSVAHVTNCTFLVSTFGADSGVFYEAATDEDGKRICTLDWKDNPDHSKLSYVKKDGKAKAVKAKDQAKVDKYIASHTRELRSIERKGHGIEGKVRSPWYDSHCLVPGATPRFIARELDMDPRGAVGKVFTSDLLTEAKKHCRNPLWQGNPVFDGEDWKLKGLLPREDGNLKLWFKPGADWSPPLGPFTVGCDLASGSDGVYSTNSVASILDDRTGEQVGEYAVKGMPLIKFARVVVGLCLWLRNAHLGWEDSGMSAPFAKEVSEVICYGNVYYREVPEIGSKRKSRKLGWANRKNEDKADLFEKMALGMETGKLVIRSEELIKECGEYEWEDGKIIHAPTKNHGAKEVNHGDRAIAAGVAWFILTEEVRDNVDNSKETIQTPEVGSFLWREMQERTRYEEGSPDFGIADVLR